MSLFRADIATPIADSRRVKPLALLLLALGAAWAPHASRLSQWTVPALVALAALRLYMAHRGYELKYKKLLLVPTLLGGWWAVDSFHPFFGGTGAIALLTVMVALKLFESFALRDFLVLALTGYALTASRILYGQTMGTALWMTALCLAFTYLIVEYSDRTGRRTTATNLRITARLFIFALPVMALLYIFFPRTGSPLWMLSSGAKAVTGMTDELRPGSISELVTSDEVAFTVEFDGKLPPVSDRYWRGLVFDEFDGAAWRGSGLEPPVARSNNAAAAASAALLSQRFEQRIMLFAHTGRWLYALDRAATAVPGRARLHKDGTLLTGRPVKDRLIYRVNSVTGPESVELTAGGRSRMLALPDGYSQKVHDLAAKITQTAGDGPGSDARKVEAALSYFRSQGFVYTLTPQTFEEDAIENFLFNSREGFCEHFATGFAVVMRAAGVPTRIIAGYLGAETNPWFDQLMVLQEHAHAWNEVWLEGQGWVRIDPTAEANPGRLSGGIDTDASLDRGVVTFELDSTFLQNIANSLGFSHLKMDRWWNEWVVGYNRYKQLEFLDKLGTGVMGRAMLYTLCALVIALWLLAVIASVLSGESKRTDPFERLWRRWLRKMKGAGHQLTSSEGPLDFGRRIAREDPDLADEAIKVTTYYCRCRYGRPLGGEVKERIKTFKVMVTKGGGLKP